MLKNRILLICFGILIFSFGSTICANPNDYRDPTQPITGTFPNQNILQENANPYGFKIDSIIMSKNRKLVSINGHQLEVGDKLDDVTVIDIYADGVRLQDSFGEFTINVPYYNIKNYFNAK